MKILRIWVLQANPKTADDALQAALRSNANLQRTPNNPKQAKESGVMIGATQAVETTNLAEAIAIALEKRGIGTNVSNRPDPGRYRGYSGRGARYSRGRGRGQYARGACHACGQPGHFWRDAICPRSPAFQGTGGPMAAGQSGNE